MDIINAQNTAKPGESVTIQTKDGRTLTGKAGNEINSTKCLAVKDEAGNITVFSGSSPHEKTRSQSIRRNRPKGKPTSIPVKILVVKELEDKFEFYLGGDRSPKKVWEKDKPINIEYAWITNTGNKINDWILTVIYYDPNVKTYIPDEFKPYFGNPNQAWWNSTLIIKIINNTGVIHTYEEGNNYYLKPRGAGCISTDLESVFIGYWELFTNVAFNNKPNKIIDTAAAWNEADPRPNIGGTLNPGFTSSVWFPNELFNPETTQYDFNGGMEFPSLETANETHDVVRGYLNYISNGDSLIDTCSGNPTTNSFPLRLENIAVGRYFVFPNYLIAGLIPSADGTYIPEHPLSYYFTVFFDTDKDSTYSLSAPFTNRANIGLDAPFDRSESPYFSEGRFSLTFGNTTWEYYKDKGGVLIKELVSQTDNIYRPVITINNSDRLLDKVYLQSSLADYQYETRKVFFTSYEQPTQTIGMKFQLGKLSATNQKTKVGDIEYNISYKSNFVRGTKYYAIQINQFERNLEINGLWFQGKNSYLRATYSLTYNQDKIEDPYGTVPNRNDVTRSFSLAYNLHQGENITTITDFGDLEEQYYHNAISGTYTALDIQYNRDNLIKNHIYRCPSDENTYNELINKGQVTITIKDYIIKEGAIALNRSFKEKVKGFQSLSANNSELKIYSISYYPN